MVIIVVSNSTYTPSFNLFCSSEQPQGDLVSQSAPDLLIISLDIIKTAASSDEH